MRLDAFDAFDFFTPKEDLSEPTNLAFTYLVQPYRSRLPDFYAVVNGISICIFLFSLTNPSRSFLESELRSAFSGSPGSDMWLSSLLFLPALASMMMYCFMSHLFPFRS